MPDSPISSSRLGGPILTPLALAACLLVWPGSRLQASDAPAKVTSGPYPDRLVWVFGWNLNQDSEMAEVTKVLDTAAQHRCNGAMLSGQLDSLCKAKPEYFARLDAVKLACERNKLDLIPAIFSVGYGSTALAHHRDLAEGLLVEDAPFSVRVGVAEFVADDSAVLANGGFEEFTGKKIKGYKFYDRPGEIGFIDTGVKHSGNASLRLENFAADPHGHGRVMQELPVRPHRCYRLSLWIKTQDLEPVSGFQISVLTGKRELAPRSFKLSPTSDWQKLTFLFNSSHFDSVRIYAGMWGGKAGKLWLDDWSVEETGPLNVLHRPGTPVTVRNEFCSLTYVEGKDYASLNDPQFQFRQVDRPAATQQVLPGSRIQDGQQLRVSWYHPMVVHDSQITACMAEPELYQVFDHEAKLLAERLHPRRVMLNMDEIRMGGTCQACKGRNMGELLGECITRQVQILRKYLPGVEVCIWSDMLDPNHNARGDYYLVDGDYTGSWKHIPKDITIVVWGGAPKEKSLRFFAEQGFRTLVGCYYDAANLDTVKGWIEAARPLPNVRGFMYTPWQKKYELLPAFGDLLMEQP